MISHTIYKQWALIYLSISYLYNSYHFSVLYLDTLFMSVFEGLTPTEISSNFNRQPSSDNTSIVLVQNTPPLEIYINFVFIYKKNYIEM